MTFWESLGRAPWKKYKNLEKTKKNKNNQKKNNFPEVLESRKVQNQKNLEKTKKNNKKKKQKGWGEWLGVLALKKQTVTAKQLSDTLTDADELIVGLVALNQKEQVWQGMALLEDTNWSPFLTRWK